MKINTHKILVTTLISLVTLAAVIIILDIWGVFIDGLMLKLLGTIGVLILFTGFLIVVKSDFGEHKRLKDENYID